MIFLKFLLSYGRIVGLGDVMKLNKFAKGAMIELKTQALEHILYAPVTSKNVENVKMFEQQHKVSVQDLGILRSYMMYLARDEKYAPLVIRNLTAYIAYLSVYIYQFKDIEFAMKKVDLDHIISLFEESSENYSVGNHSFQRSLLCSDILSRAHVMVSDSEKMEQEMIEFIPKKFSYSSTIINQNDEEMSGLLQNPSFLQYCNFLINSKSPLLYMNCFADQVLEILDTNADFKTFQGCDSNRRVPSSMPSQFYRENERIARRIRNLL